jgi:hypothetical protein
MQRPLRDKIKKVTLSWIRKIKVSFTNDIPEIILYQIGRESNTKIYLLGLKKKLGRIQSFEMIPKL